MARHQEVNFKFQTWYLEFLLFASRSPSGAPSTSAIKAETPTENIRMVRAVLLETSRDKQGPPVTTRAHLAVVLGMWLDWRHADAGVGIGMPALVEGAPEGLLDAKGGYSRYQI